jgi:hypothetical protein
MNPTWVCWVSRADHARMSSRRQSPLPPPTRRSRAGAERLDCAACSSSVAHGTPPYHGTLSISLLTSRGYTRATRLAPRLRVTSRSRSHGRPTPAPASASNTRPCAVAARHDCTARSDSVHGSHLGQHFAWHCLTSRPRCMAVHVQSALSPTHAPLPLPLPLPPPHIHNNHMEPEYTDTARYIPPPYPVILVDTPSPDPKISQLTVDTTPYHFNWIHTSRTWRHDFHIHHQWLHWWWQLVTCVSREGR